MKRSEGERIRAKAVLDRLQACIKGVELALADENTPVGHEAGQEITNTAIQLAVLLAKIDAYQRAEVDSVRARHVLRDLLREEPLIYEGNMEAKLYVSVDALEEAQAVLREE